MHGMYRFLVILIGVSPIFAAMALGQSEDAGRTADAMEAFFEEADAEQYEELPTDIFYCGGETSRAAVATFFARLRKGIDEDRPVSYFNQFVGERFSVVRDERYLVFDREDFQSVTPRFFSREDWIRIASLGARSLNDVGWRGCILDRGKVGFAADENGLRIYSINHDMTWMQSD